MRGSVKVQITPMFKQYFEIKSKYPDAILFFRLGDFYEMFFEDAETVAPLLGLVLTKREAGKNLTAPMCGIPAEKSGFYIQKLVDMGFKVAICEQVEDPATAKGLVKREVVKIYTPGLFIELEGLSEKEKNYLAGIYFGKKVGIAFLELSCGEFVFTELKEDTFLSELLKKEPREIVLSKKLEKSQFTQILKQNLPKVHLSFVEEIYFNKENLEALVKDRFLWEKYSEGLSACAGIVEYLKNYQPALVEKIEEPEFYFPEEFLFLDEATKRNLELLKNLWDRTEKYSLFWVLDKTSTPMGARLLKEWILYPLRNKEKILERQAVVKFFVENRILREEVKKILKKLPDLERLGARCGLKLANPRELALLRDGLSFLPALKETLNQKKEEISEFPRKLEETLKNVYPFEDLYLKLKEMLVEEPPTTLKEGGIINKKAHPELEKLVDLKENAIFYLSELEKKEKQKTGIPTLKIGYNRVFGYYFEVSKSYLNLVPSYFERKQTLTNAERFITKELKELEEKILSAEEKIKNLEYELFLNLREEVSRYKEELKLCARAIAEIDVYLALAETAVENEYVQPELVEEEVLEIEEGRHPVLEKIQGRENFVPNSLKMDKESAKLLIITGPNMGGKSTYLRQTALIVLMAQMGGFVPASRVKMGIFDRIFSRVGAGDELVRGKSTFMVEMQECAHILKNATSKSLVILDEVGRGTSTYDGLSLAWAIAEYLYNKNIFTLLATHYFELTELSSLYSGIKNYHVSVKEWKDEIVFLYKVVEGSASESYGIEVAKLAGIPKEVVDRAKEILYKLESKNLKTPKEITISTKRVTQLPIFEITHPVIEKLKKIKVEEMTPIEALNFLWEIKRQIS